MQDRYQTVLLFGAPGAGKGTQGKILGLVPGFFHLACGDVFDIAQFDDEPIKPAEPLPRPKKPGGFLSESKEEKETNKKNSQGRRSNANKRRRIPKQKTIKKKRDLPKRLQSDSFDVKGFTTFPTVCWPMTSCPTVSRSKY